MSSLTSLGVILTVMDEDLESSGRGLTKFRKILTAATYLSGIGQKARGPSQEAGTKSQENVGT